MTLLSSTHRNSDGRFGKFPIISRISIEASVLSLIMLRISLFRLEVKLSMFISKLPRISDRVM